MSSTKKPVLVTEEDGGTAVADMNKDDVGVFDLTQPVGMKNEE